MAARGPMRTSAPTDGANHVGRGLLDAPDLPPGGKVARPKAVTDEGATDRLVLGGHTGPPLQMTTDRNFRGAGPMWPPAGARCAPLRMVRTM